MRLPWSAAQLGVPSSSTKKRYSGLRGTQQKRMDKVTRQQYDGQVDAALGAAGEGEMVRREGRLWANLFEYALEGGAFQVCHRRLHAGHTPSRRPGCNGPSYAAQLLPRNVAISVIRLGCRKLLAGRVRCWCVSCLTTG